MVLKSRITQFLMNSDAAADMMKKSICVEPELYVGGQVPFLSLFILTRSQDYSMEAMDTSIDF
jgi:hypothetical protein